MYICPTPPPLLVCHSIPPSWYSFFFIVSRLSSILLMLYGSFNTQMAYWTLTYKKIHCMPDSQARSHYTLLSLALNLFQKFFRKKPVRDLLPTKPAVLKVLEPWWIVQIGYVTEDDIRVRRKRSFQYNTLGKIGLLEKCYKFVIFVWC